MSRQKGSQKEVSGLYFYISLFWFALEFCWQGLATVILPSHLLHFVSASVKGSALALLFSAGALISMFIQPLVGTMSDYSAHPLGRRRPFLITGTLLLCASLMLLGFSPNYSFFFLSVIFIFVATDFAQAPSQGFIPDLIPPAQRGKATGMMGFSTILGALGGPLVAGFLLGVHQTGLAISVIIINLLVAMIITVTKVKEKVFTPPAHLSFKEKVSHAFRFKIKEYPDFYWLQLARFFVILALTIMLVFFLYYLKDVIKVAQPEKSTGILMSFAAAAALLSILPSSLLSDRFGRKPLLYLAGLLAMISIVPLFFALTFTHTLVIASFFGLAYGMFSGVIWALNIDVVPLAEAGKYLGYTQLSTSLAQIIAPIMGGPVIDLFRAERTGYNIIFGIAIFSMMLGMLILRKVKETTRLKTAD